MTGERTRLPHPPTCADPDAQHIGVVMVHGVGFQQPGETLLRWSRALERVLRGWALSRRLPNMPATAADVGLGPTDERLVELQLPDQPEDSQAGWSGALHMVITEALWAPYLREPSTHDVSAWLGEHGAAGRLADRALGLRAGGEALESQSNLYVDESAGDDATPAQSTMASLRQRVRASPNDPAELARVVGRSLLLGFNRLRVGVIASGFASVLLLVFGALRAVTRLLPFVGGLVGRIDRLLTGLAGDMQTLLDDPPQSANVRQRLAAAIDTLEGYGCDRVVLVAHSGGVAASYMLLNDPTYRDLPVDGLLSFGQGLSASWALTDAYSTAGCEAALRMYPLVVRDPRRGRSFAWNDYWASDDPVPAGSLRFPACASGHVDAEHGSLWNRASSSADHTGYWENDEEFVMPVLADIAALADRRGGTSPIGWQHHDALVERRQRRVSLLALWRRLAFIVLPVTVVIAFTRESYGGLDDLGLAVTRVWNAIPFHELVSTPVHAFQAWAADVLLPNPVGSAVVLLGGVMFVGVASLIGASVIVPFGRWGPWRSSPRLATTLRLIDVGAGLSLFVVSAVAVGVAFILPLLVVILASAATLVAQRIAEQMAANRTAQMWGLTAVYLVGFAAFAVAWLAVLAVPLATQVLLGIGVLYLFVSAIRGVGNWLWSSWDEYERRLAVRDVVPTGEGWYIAGSGIALAGSLIGLVAAVGFANETPFGVGLPIVASLVCIGLVVVVVLTTAARASLRSD